MTLRDLFTGKVLEMELSDLAPIADLVLAAVLGGIAVCIALLQWRTHQRRVDSEQRDRQLQRQRDLYDRRWRVYDGVLAYLREMTGDLNPETMLRALFELHRVRTEAHFLFGFDVRTYLEELTKHGRTFRKSKVKALSPNYDHEKVAVAAEESEEVRWFSEQFATAPQLFEAYLRLSDD